MPTFEYQAVNSAGERVSGVVGGSSIEQVLASLSNSGFSVERINQSQLLEDSASGQAVVAPPPIVQQQPSAPNNPYQQQVPPQGAAYQERSAHEPKQAPPTEQRSYVATSVIGPLTGGVPLPALSFFYRQFGTMLEAGVPIVQSLDTLGNQSHNLKLRQVVREMRGHVEAGRDISTGMQRYPEVFVPLSVSLIRAGEEGGFVAQSFKQLADYTDKEVALRNLVRRLTLYPKIVLVVSILLIGGVNILISMLGKESMLSSPLTNWTTWIFLGPILIGAFLFFRVGLANPRIKFNWDTMLVKFPFGVGRTVHEFAMSKFGTAMAFLYKGGVPVQKAISLAADACGNEYIRAQVSPAGRRLDSGDGITETLRSTNAFSPIVLDMMDTGEHTGNLDGMLFRMASFYEDEAETRAKQVAQIFSTIIYILVALYVAYVVIKFFMAYVGQVGSAGSEE